MLVVAALWWPLKTASKAWWRQIKASVDEEASAGLGISVANLDQSNQIYIKTAFWYQNWYAPITEVKLSFYKITIKYQKLARLICIQQTKKKLMVQIRNNIWTFWTIASKLAIQTFLFTICFLVHSLISCTYLCYFYLLESKVLQ